MVKQRQEQARLDKMHELGRKNVETLRDARAWCKHIHAEMTSYGLLAETSGLPIGSHDVTCVHAAHAIGGMNLPLILPHFVIQNCRGCKSHSPNGNTTWGDGIIEQYEAGVKKNDERQSSFARQLAEVRVSRSTLARHALGQADFSVHKVLELTERLFDDDAAMRNDASTSLQQAATLAPELFHPAAIDLILESAPQPQLADLCLPLAAALAAHRPDLADRLVSVATQALKANLSVEMSCQIMVGCGCGTDRAFPIGVIDTVVERQNHIRPIGGWPTKDPDCPLVDVPPSYSFSTTLLIRAYDQESETLLTPIRAAFRDNNKYRRVNACGVVTELMGQRPAIGGKLLDVIVASLDLDDDPYNDSADGAACALIGTIYFSDAAQTDNFITDQFTRQSQEARCLTADIYQNIVRTEPEDQRGLPRTQFDKIVGSAFRRCLELVQNQGVDLEVRKDFADAIESGCRHNPDVAMADFDTLLGTLACLCSQSEPPAQPPRIILPYAEPPDPALRGLEHIHRQQTWRHFKSTLATCLEELCKERPQQAAQRLLGCFASLDSRTHEALKAEIVTLLGELGRNRDLLPQVLPLLWKALMDYESVLVRGHGIQAIARCFEAAECDPPSDVVEALVLHLKDSYVFVHLSAIRAVAWNTSWLTRSQAEDAIQQLANWGITYRTSRPFELRDICRPILSLSRTLPGIRNRAVRFVSELLPTGQSHVDTDLIEMLVREVKPEEHAALCVAQKAAAWLAGDARHLFDHHDDERELTYDWLRRIPQELYLKTRTELTAAGMAIAKDGDVWHVLRFAALFDSFGDFVAEADVLGTARGNLPEGRRNEHVIKTLGELERASRLNAQLAGLE